MPLNRVRTLWQSGKAAYGALVSMPSPQVVQVLSRSGFDFLLFDMEHSPIDLGAAHAMILATAGTPTVPMARIAANVPWLSKPLLDAGMLGIAVPMVCSKAEAETAAKSMRYPPTGERMWGPFYAPMRWDLSMRDYMRAADDEVVLMVAIEHINAIRRIEEIVEVSGIDIAVIGPGDLATSLGHHGQVEHPEVLAAMREAERAILRTRIGLGGVAFSPEQANRMVDIGYRMLFLGFDWSLLQKGAAAALHGLKR